jgi:hypothetical protein
MRSLMFVIVLFYPAFAIAQRAGGSPGQDPMAWTDVARFKVRAVGSGVPYTVAGITAKCTSGNTSLPVSAASLFQDGDGVDVWGCGATNNMSTPSAPTVTNTWAAGPLGTGYDSNVGTGGSTKYCFRVAARDVGQGLTAASPETCLPTGYGKLGTNSWKIANCTKSGHVNTCVTTSAHGLPVGCTVCPRVQIIETSDDGDFGGWFVLASVPNTTSFTYMNGMDTADGSLSSCTGGTVYAWAAIHVVMPPPPSGAIQFYIYGGTSNAETLLDVSNPVDAASFGHDPAYLVYDYFGPIYSGNVALPLFVPQNYPKAPTNDTLVTTIASGAGTTTLTLATAPTQNFSETRILFDNVPNIRAAATEAYNGGGAVYFPAVASGLSFVTNSYMTTASANFEFAGPLSLGDTWKFQGSGLSGTRSLGVCPQFCIEEHVPFYTNRGNPGLLADMGGTIGSIRDLSITTTGNRYNGMLVVGGIPSLVMENVSFSTFAGANDYLGTFFTAWAQFAAGGSAGISLRNVLFNAGPKQMTGIPAGPMAVFKNYGEITLDGLMMNRRGLLFVANQAGLNLNISERYEEQGQITPQFTVYAPTLNVDGWIAIRNTICDTSNSAMLEHMGGFSGGVVIENEAYCRTAVTGRPFGRILFTNVGGGWSGQNFSTVQWSNSANIPNYINGEPIILTGTSKLGVGQIANPSVAPSVSVGTACSGYPTAGTHAYSVAFRDALGGITLLSPSTKAAVDGSTQCVTITQPTPPAGAAYWGVYEDAFSAYDVSHGLGGCGPSYTPISYTTIIVQRPFKCGSGPFANTTSMQNLSSSGIYGNIISTTETTQAQCFSSTSPATCASTINGFVAIRVGSSSVVVNTTAVTANSEISLTFDTTQGAHLGVTCNTTAQQPYISARTAGASFTISVPSSFSGNPGCIGFHIKN